ncbi:MAG: anti-sigma factor [Spirochaetia bacterium]
MARIDDLAATAARRILGLEEVVYAESSAGDDRVQALLQVFYSLAQLTPDIPLPEAVATRVNRRLASDAEGGPANTDSAPTDATRPRSGDRRSLVRRALAAGVRMPVTALVMLVVAFLLSIGANLLLSRAGEFRPEVAIHLIGTAASPETKGVVLFDGKRIVLHAGGLAELTSGYRYVAWNASGTVPQYLGSLTMLSDSTARLLTSADELIPTIVVTIEPSASPTEPTGPQILVGRTID